MRTFQSIVTDLIVCFLQQHKTKRSPLRLYSTITTAARLPFLSVRKLAEVDLGQERVSLKGG